MRQSALLVICLYLFDSLSAIHGDRPDTDAWLKATEDVDWGS
jgi:hypothetical protein